MRTELFRIFSVSYDLFMFFIVLCSICRLTFQIVGNLISHRFWKMRAPNNDANWLNQILEIMDMKSISIKKYEMAIW